MLRTLLTALISGEVAALARSARRAAILYALAAIAFAAAFGFLVGALFVFVSERFGAIATAIGFATGFIIVGVSCLVANGLRARAARHRRQAEREPELRGLAIAAALAALPSLLSSRKALAGLAVPLLGLLALKIHDENRKKDGDGDNA